jgi:sugar lactone lactonase YvrE
MNMKSSPLAAALLALVFFADAGRSQSNVPPAIISQPQNATVTNVTTVAFTVGVSGTGPFSYQWLVNGQYTTNNIISTVVGTSSAQFSGDGGPAANAALNRPSGVALDNDGNLFIADTFNERIRRVDTNGIITTVAGNGGDGYSGNGNVATNSSLDAPSGMAVDADDNLFIADTYNARLRVATYDILITAAGNGTQGYAGDGASAYNAELQDPYGVAVDADGNIYIADTFNQRIRKVDVYGIITTVAGTGVKGYSGDGGASTNAELNWPFGVAVDGSGSLFIADRDNNRIRKVSANGVITTVAGNGIQGFSGDDGAATNAELSQPDGVSLDAYGDIIIADTINNRIREVNAAGNMTTLAGNGTPGFSNDGGTATNASLASPAGVVVDASGNLLIADTFNNRIRKVTRQGPVFTVSNVNLANAGAYQVIVSSAFGSVTSSVAVLTVDVPPVISQQPAGQAIINGSNATLSVVAPGTAPLSYQWQFNGTNLTDGGNLSGSTTPVLSFSPATGTNTGLYDVIVTNTWGSVTSSVVVLTVVYPPAITNQPVSATVVNGGNASFGVTATGTGPLSYQWQFNGINLTDGGDLAGSATTNLVITGATAANGGLYDVIVANAWGSVTSSVATLTIAFPPGITSQPTDEMVVSGTHTNLSVTATGTAPLSYQWQFDGTNLTDGGYVSGSATTNLNVALVTTNNAGLYDVIIANAWGSVTSRLASVTVVLPPAIVVQPAATNVLLGENTAFTVAASGTAPLFYRWQFNDANLTDGGQISGSATAALLVTQITTNNVGSYDVIVANAWGSVTSVVATLNIALPPTITVQPMSVTTNLNGDLNFDASVTVTATGTAPLSYQWQFNGTNLPDEQSNPQDANSSRLFFDPVRTNNAGPYDVVITNLWGSVTSSVVTLTILYPPTITNQPVSQVVTNANAVTFTVGASGVGPFTYQWLFNGKIITNNIITTVAGVGSPQGSFSGDGGPATNAVLGFPSGVALDAEGNLLIADTDNNRIRKVNTNGIITTVAGNGDGGYNGNGNVATNSWLNRPAGVAVDAYDNLFIADEANARVREVAYEIMITLAGNGSDGFSGDGGAAYNAELFEPSGVAVDAGGNIYIADTENSRIRKVDVNDNITTIAGGISGPDGAGDGGPATNANLTYPSGIAVDSYGNLFIADTRNQRIRKVDTNGIITTVAGKGSEGYSGDGGLATNALVNIPSGVAVDGYGNLYIADTGNSRVRKVNTSGIITTVAGAGTIGFHGDGGAATNAWLDEPAGVTVDARGDLFIADTDNQRIREVTPQGPSLTVANLTITNAGNYQVIVSNAGGSVTSSVATLTIDVPPAITQQPVSQSVISGGTVTFRVTATGTNLVYWWQFDGTDLGVAEPDGPTLTLSSITAANAGAYQLVITNRYGSVTSTVAILTVSSPHISALVATNGSVTLTLVTAGNISSRVLAATNLVPPVIWLPIFTNVPGTNGVWQFADTNINKYPVRFYRTTTP